MGGHPVAWELRDLLEALERHGVRSVLDARPDPETGPSSETVRVGCIASGMKYERQPMLSMIYTKLVAQARGISSDACRPCVLLSGVVAWRLQQTRRCIVQAMKMKGVEVYHLLWSGDIDN